MKISRSNAGLTLEVVWYSLGTENFKKSMNIYSIKVQMSETIYVVMMIIIPNHSLPHSLEEGFESVTCNGSPVPSRGRSERIYIVKPFPWLCDFSWQMMWQSVNSKRSFGSHIDFTQLCCFVFLFLICQERACHKEWSNSSSSWTEDNSGARTERSQLPSTWEEQTFAGRSLWYFGVVCLYYQGE